MHPLGSVVVRVPQVVEVARIVVYRVCDVGVPAGIEVYGGVKGVVGRVDCLRGPRGAIVVRVHHHTGGGGHVHVCDVGVAGVVDRYRRVVPGGTRVVDLLDVPAGHRAPRVHKAGRARVEVRYVLVSRSVQRHGDAVAADAVGLPVDGGDFRAGAPYRDHLHERGVRAPCPVEERGDDGVAGQDQLRPHGHRVGGLPGVCHGSRREHCPSVDRRYEPPIGWPVVLLVRHVGRSGGAVEGHSHVRPDIVPVPDLQGLPLAIWTAVVVGEPCPVIRVLVGDPRPVALIQMEVYAAR